MRHSEQRYDEARRLSGMLIDIAGQTKADFAEIVAELDLPVHLARAVLMLDEPAPMRDLADRLACDRSYVTNLADRLEERGLVERVSGTDRRVKLLSLTDAGIATRDAISHAVAARSMLLTRLTDAQRAALAPLLEALTDADGRRSDGC